MNGRQGDLDVSSFVPGGGDGEAEDAHGAALSSDDESRSRSSSDASRGDHGRTARSDVSAGVLRMAAQASVLHGDSDDDDVDKD